MLVNKGSCCCTCICSLFIFISLLLIAAGLTIGQMFGIIFTEQLKELMPLANGSMSYRGWEKVPTDLLFEIWVWNVTNAEQITKHGAKPRLQQVGPFAFRETRYKTDIEFYDNNTVAFREYQMFYFDVSKSLAPMEDVTVTSVSMPYAVTAFQMQPAPSFLRRIANRVFHAESGGLFMTRNVREVLLGYDDRLLLKVKPYVKRYAPTMKFQSETGLFIGTNHSHKGLFLVHTGKGDLDKFNQIEKWNGNSKIDVWPEEWANRIVGTDGSMFAPQVTTSSRIKLYTTDICRSLEMEFKGRNSILGIPSLQFGPRVELMLNATVLPKNAAFCIPKCLDSGVLNITKCQQNVPLAISAPHFTDAPTYAAAIDGVNPQEQYRTRIDVEPNTGFVINAGRKMQMNIILEKDKYFEDLKMIPEILLLPLMWLNESGGIEPHAAEQFKSHLLAPIQIVENSKWPLVGCGICLGLVTLIIWVFCLRKMRRQGQTKLPIVNRNEHRRSIFVDDDLLQKLQNNSLKETDIL